MRPTVLDRVPTSVQAWKREIFGPVLGLRTFDSLAEAIRLANDTDYGLQASVWTKDTARGEQVARRIEAGTVTVNDAQINYVALELPMGGWKTSGIGSRHGAYGIKKFVRAESILAPRFAQGKADPLWFPRSKRKMGAVGRVLRFFNARGLRNRLGL